MNFYSHAAGEDAAIAASESAPSAYSKGVASLVGEGGEMSIVAMGRKTFNSFLQEVYGRIDQHLIKPVRSFSYGDLDVEVFDSPTGVILVGRLIDYTIVSASAAALNHAEPGRCHRVVGITAAGKLKIRVKA